MTQTETTSLAAMALALAGAKKPCSVCLGVQKLGYPLAESCDREEYILPKETRVECLTCEGVGTLSSFDGEVDCTGCNGEGWRLPLDPMLLGCWQLALAEAGYLVSISTQRIDYHVLIQRKRGPGFWEAAADTPELAFFQAAMLALGLDQAVDDE